MKDDQFEDLIKQLQEKSFNEARAAFGEKGFDRWRNPKYCGILERPNAYARLTGDCGDTMEMYLKVSKGTVEEVSYRTDGCGSSSVAGSFAAELASGKSFEEVLDLRGADVLAIIGKFPEQEEHCAHLAISTIQEALNDYLIEHTKDEGGEN